MSVPAIVLAALVAGWASAQPQGGAGTPPDLQQAGAAGAQAAGNAAKSIQGRNEFKRLQKDLRYIAEELDRELLGPRLSAHDLGIALAGRVAGLRARGNIDPRLGPTLDKVEWLVSTMEQRADIEHYLYSFLRHLSEELRWAAEVSQDSSALLARLDADLDVPIDAERFFPEDLPLKEWRKLGMIKKWLMKHRVRRPATHTPTSALAIQRGRHNVQIGVEIEGLVHRRGRLSVDGDTTFDIGDLHIEITPEWRLTHARTMPIPKNGDRVRLRGWTYYDSFHKAEEEYDPNHPVLGAKRKTLWEIHPLQDVTVLQAAPGDPGDVDEMPTPQAPKGEPFRAPAGSPEAR